MKQVAGGPRPAARAMARRRRASKAPARCQCSIFELDRVGQRDARLTRHQPPAGGEDLGVRRSRVRVPHGPRRERRVLPIFPPRSASNAPLTPAASTYTDTL